MRMSIIGLGFAGKTTFFQILTKHGMKGSLSGKKGATIGTVFVPDPRLDRLTATYNPKKQVNASIEFIDTPSLSAEGSGKSFSSAALEEVRRADTLCLIIHAFESESYPHPMGSTDGPRDLDFIISEFILNDLMVLEQRAQKLRKLTRIAKQDSEVRELAAVEKAIEALNAETPLRDVELSEQEQAALSAYQLISMKPLLVVLNVNESQVAEMDIIPQQIATQYRGLTFMAMCAELELELADMEPNDATEFMADLGIHEPAFQRIIRACFEVMGLRVFFTVGDDECRAWPIPRNMTAFDSAGQIHSDIQRGFIRAMVMPYSQFDAAPEEGTFKANAVQQRKDYIMQDGDIVNFLFNVSK